MTYSILVRDPATGIFGGAAATGNLCVGGWVLRGDPRIGLSASQGKTPSTLWGEDVLVAMGDGLCAQDAVDVIVNADGGRTGRQLLALDRHGSCGHFTGGENVPYMAHIVTPDSVVAGNMLADPAVIRACHRGYLESAGPLPRRLLKAMKAAAIAGGDMRGLMSAAILTLGENAPPIDLRVDHSLSPLEDLEHLVSLTEAADYMSWRETLPTRSNPFR